MLSGNFAEMTTSTPFRDLLHATDLRHGADGRCKQDRIFPWPVIIVVTFGLKFKFTASLLSTLGKKLFGNHPFRCFLPLALPFSYAFFPGIPFYSAFGIFLYVNIVFFELPPSQVDLIFPFREFQRELSPI